MLTKFYENFDHFGSGIFFDFSEQTQYLNVVYTNFGNNYVLNAENFNLAIYFKNW